MLHDLFGEAILAISLSHESGLRSGKSTAWEGGFLYNQFLPEHQRLLAADAKDLSASFKLEAVVYADGTRERFAP